MLGIWVFGGNDDEATDGSSTDPDETDGIELEEDTDDEEDDNEDLNDSVEDGTVTEEAETTDEETNEEDNNSSEENIETQPAESVSDDDNVIEAYTANWQPVGTEQEGPHTTQFDPDSQDWKEMLMAIRLATGLSEDDMITLWLGNGGDQKAIGTVSNSSHTEFYRVYISWVDNEGWQPTLVEVLKENDID
nr:YrrS family protein [Ornithinibacillus caprae]